MPEIEIFIQNRAGTVNRRMFQYSGLEVIDALNDARTCRFTCPITDTNALNQSNIQHFLPHHRLVMVLYRDRPIFWGPIIKPVFNFKENRVEVNCHDPSIYWKNHHLDDREAEDITEIKVNGKGVWDLAVMADVTAAEFADGAPDPGVLTAQNGDIEDYFIDPPEDSADDRRTVKLRRGASIFDSIQEMTEAGDGPEWALIPVNENYDPYGDSPGPGYYSTLVAKREIGEDKSEEVIFHYGWGRTNLDNFIYEPDGSTVVNRAVVENGRGVYRVAKYLDGYSGGIMESWESSSGGRAPRPEALEEKAKATVEAYGRPLDIFTIEPTWDQGLMGSAASTPWRYPTGYSVGDFIRVIAKLDRLTVDLVGRVVKVTLTQLNAAENVLSQVECLPRPDDIADDVTSGEDIQ